MTTLDRLEIGRTARIAGLTVDGNRATQLMEMGMTPGTEVVVARVAPFGGPIDVLVRGYHLSLRKCEAGRITVMRDRLEDALA